ncbi:MAG: YicC/YloC family endoribonuclease [Phycisphaerae bacterium]|nr:YicC/YloC family endoribonuclease [Phycisphaerae bacterium]
MTGFGVATADTSSETGGRQYSVEVRSVNNKFFKATVRVPDELSALEAELESALARRVARGSVTVTVRMGLSASDAAGEVNVDAARAFVLRMAAAMPPELADRMTIDLATLLTVPGVVGISADRVSESARPVLLRLLNEACDRMLTMRVREGEGLHALLASFGAAMRERLAIIRERAPEVIRQYQERLRLRINTMLADVGTSVKDEDLLREVAMFAERADIAEEIARLTGHLDQFDAILSPANNEPAGRTLDFLAQEMLREANTIASKSADGEIARRIVEIKTAIDRIKEQAANAE